MERNVTRRQTSSRVVRGRKPVHWLLAVLALSVAPFAWAEDDDDEDEDDREIVAALPADIAYSARAEERETYPRLEGEIAFGVENDATYRAQDDEEELNSAFASAEAEFELAFTPNFSVEAELTLEPLEDADDGRLEERLRARDDSPDNREFDDHALFVEQFLGRWQGEKFEVHFGKFNPRFGKAYEFEVGPYGDEDNFTEDYAIEERLGGGISVDLGSATIGSHMLSFEAFTLDTTNSTRGFLRSRGRVKRDDGGPSNTGDLGSFAFGLQGEEIPGVERLSYNLGFVYQKGGEAGPFADFPRSGFDGAMADLDLDDDRPGPVRRRVLDRDDDEDDGAAEADDDDDQEPGQAPDADGDDDAADAGGDDDDEDEGAFMRDRGSLERDYVAGLQYALSPWGAAKTKLLTELVYIQNADGEKDRLRRFLTLATATEWKGFRFGLSYTLRTEAIPMESDDRRSYLGLASIGYFRPVGRGGRLGKIGFETGIRLKRDLGQRSNTIPVRLTFRTEF
jgi:hypothetical protein